MALSTISGSGLREILLIHSPQDISYNASGISIGEYFFSCERPRLEFARALKYYEDKAKSHVLMNSVVSDLQPISLPRNSGDVVIASNTLYDIRRVKIGSGCVIGDHGFGYEYDEQGQLFPMPHLGYVEIGDNVEIRNNVCIDRGVLGSTKIGEGTKIDNLCHVAHNVQIGKNNLIAALCSIEGSVIIGDNNKFGSKVVVQRKVKIGSHCIFGSGAVVTKDVEDYSVMVGCPAKLLKTNKPCAE